MDKPTIGRRIVSEEVEAFEAWQAIAYPAEQRMADGERAARIEDECSRRKAAILRGETIGPWSEFKATL